MSINQTGPDWKDVLLRVLMAVETATGVVFDEFWAEAGVGDETRMELLEAMNERFGPPAPRP